MAAHLSPGVYVRETDFSFYVKQISTSACGMVGIAERGPINKPVLVTSWEQFVRTFGGYITAGYLAYAARSFFDNGGGVLYVCRTAHYSDPTNRASLTAEPAFGQVNDRGTPGSPTLAVRALNEGKWGEQLSVTIEDGTRFPVSEFNLVVRHKGEVVEVWKDLSMDEAAPNHAELAINERSSWITVEDLDSVATGHNDRPRIGTTVLAGGNDGLFELNDIDFTGDPSQHTGMYAFDEVDALNILALPGLTSPEAIHAGITYAEGRKDLLFIAETPMHLEPLEAVDFRKGQGMYTGINIWGQRTLQSQPSALDRINVRRLMMYVEEAIAESSRFVVFEPNNPQTWRALIRLVNPFLQEIKTQGGFYDFAVQCDGETNPSAVTDRNEMVARIFVKPTKTAEFVELNFVLTATGGDFKEIFPTG